MSKSNPAKLTDLQLLLLSKASQRDDHTIHLPPNLKGGAATKVIRKLLDSRLAEEVVAAPGMPVWRRDDESRSLALIITRGAFELLGIEPDAHVEATPAFRGGAKGGSKRTPKGTRSHNRSIAKVTQKCPDAEAAPRTGTKQALVIMLLQREHGATIDDLMAATHWLPHTTRAALTGLRKKGYEIAKDKGEDGRKVYRIEADPDAAKEPAASVSSKAA